MTDPDYYRRYKDCQELLRRGCGDYSKFSRRDMMRLADDLVNSFDEEDRFNEAVAAYVEKNYANAIVVKEPSSDYEHQTY